MSSGVNVPDGAIWMHEAVVRFKLEFGAAPLICRRATDDLEILMDPSGINSRCSRANSVLSPSTLNELLDSLSVIRMGSLHNKISRYLCLRIEFKYSKGFIRPVDLSA